MGDAQSFSGLTSKNPPLDAMLNFDADVKKRPRVINVKTSNDSDETHLRLMSRGGVK